MYRIAHVQVGDGPQVDCYSPPELAIHVGDECIVQTEQALEHGRVLDLQEVDGEAPGDNPVPCLVRQATLQDQAKAHENALMSKIARETAEKSAANYGLDIRLVRVRYSFDRALLRILFASEERVDFRDMIRDLAKELRARIEMRQIGVRDEAGIIGGMGPCGRRLCCCTWLNHFESINVKMAKTQRLSLNPSAISGMCGRLKCCLRYEYDLYRELGRRAPRQGTRVCCPGGETGCVIDCDILSRCVKVRLGDDRVVTCGMDELGGDKGSRERSRRREDEDSCDQRPQSESAGNPRTGDLRAEDVG